MNNSNYSKVLIDKVSLKNIFDEVESVFGKEAALGRNVKMFLCQRDTGEKLKDIGGFFGIEKSGVSHTCRRVKDKIRKDKNVKNEDLTPYIYWQNDKNNYQKNKRK